MAQITAGIKVKWGSGTASTTPTSWTALPGITEIPEIGGAPETYETTSLDNLEYKTYVDGLKDTGGALAFVANDTPEFREAVEALIAAQGQTDAVIWFGIEIPAPIDQHMKFKGEAAPLGFGGAAINGVLTTTLYITPTGEPAWADGALTPNV